MAMITPICLENLIEIGKWLGRAESEMEKATQATGLPQTEMLAGYSLSEIEAARKRMLQNCPKRAETTNGGMSAQVRFYLTLEGVRNLWNKQNHVPAILQLKELEETLMDWVDDIAFYSPSRHTAEGALR